MKRRRRTEPQIVFALQQAEAGTLVADILRNPASHSVGQSAPGPLTLSVAISVIGRHRAASSNSTATTLPQSTSAPLGSSR